MNRINQLLLLLAAVATLGGCSEDEPFKNPGWTDEERKDGFENVTDFQQKAWAVGSNSVAEDLDWSYQFAGINIVVPPELAAEIKAAKEYHFYLVNKSSDILEFRLPKRIGNSTKGFVWSYSDYWKDVSDSDSDHTLFPEGGCKAFMHIPCKEGDFTFYFKFRTYITPTYRYVMTQNKDTKKWEASFSEVK